MQGFSGVTPKILSLPFRYLKWHNRIKSSAYAFPVSGSNQPEEHHFQTKNRGLIMASIALVRVSGSVLSVPPARDYTFPQGSPRAGEKLTFESANVLVADMNVTAVDLPRRDNTGVFEGLNTRELVKGEIVDFLCEVSIYKQDVQTRVIGLWPSEDASYLAA